MWTALFARMRVSTSWLLTVELVTLLQPGHQGEIVCIPESNFIIIKKQIFSHNYDTLRQDYGSLFTDYHLFLVGQGHGWGGAV
jgi:hypothetical protein